MSCISVFIISKNKQFHLFTNTYNHTFFIDVSGGYSPSMFNAVQTAIDASKALGFMKGEEYKTLNGEEYKPLNHHEALYMATLGGAKGINTNNL